MTATPMPLPADTDPLLASGRRVFAVEIASLAALQARLDESFAAACRLLIGCRGRVVCTGMGKSGHIARKIAATLASTGTPALFVHAAEAAHGDLGMVTRDDVFIAMSYSGEGDELLTIVPLIKREGTPMIAITGKPTSSLAKYADVHLDCHVAKEACPLNLAPTSSTTAMLALGDALAVACLDARGFGPQDFARSHPGGSLGRKLLIRVADVMRTGDAIPVVRDDARLLDALHEITSKKMGMTAVLDAAGRLAGVFTEGDLRRLIERVGDVRPLLIADVMTRTPLTVGSQQLAAEAAEILDRTLRNQLLVVDDGKLVGALHMHDLAAARLM